MRSELKYWLQELHFLYPGEDYEGHRKAVQELLQKPEIKYQSHEALAARPGESEQIVQELSQKFNISPDTVKKYVYKI